ncbi:hypothetical protein DESUT3_15730 [Desulfuromonas versatilis]|uniref:Response regulatory domain-containing protein n=1 Tax=Desulfuromonas versatilis TaxID=2802975 RepID=A0ABM8HRG2_9BACT|nr:response regulator [Desulfuromonas versatilis]BCR04504.1 hypothetical protein DESUT3_15730 [Desulfuromonas versatilis]
MKFRAIVLEDDEGCRELLTVILRQRGYEVLSFADPTVCPIFSEPMNACPHEDACGDILVSDNHMPRLSGIEFVEAQTLRGCKGIIQNKAIISANWSQEEREKAERLGCRIFSKPFDIDEICNWLEEREKQIPPSRKLASFNDPAEPGSE